MNQISRNSHSFSKKYKCEKCKDTGFTIIHSDKCQPTMRVCECRKKESSKKQWANYGVDPTGIKTLGQFDTRNERLLERAKNLALNYVSNVENNKNWIAFMGQSGSGKSHLSKAIGAMLIKKGFKVVYMPYSEVVMELKRNTMNEENYNKILNKFMKADVLIIDDLFKEKIKNNKLTADLTEADLKHIYPLLNYRYNNNLRTVISTEATLQILRALDEALCGRIVEKCVDNIVVFNDMKYNYRFRNI